MVRPDQAGPLRLLGQTERGQTRYELLEDAAGSLFLAEFKPGTAPQRHNLHTDWAALQDARDLFPELLPFAAYPVDAG